MSMESIHGAPIVPPTLPQVRPRSTPERDVHGSDSGGAASNHVGTPADRSRVSLPNTDAAPSLELTLLRPDQLLERSPLLDSLAHGRTHALMPFAVDIQ